MTDTKQPEALRLALSIDVMDTFTNYQQEELEKAAAELRRLHAENTTLQQGYDAARMEIDSLRTQLKHAELAADAEARMVDERGERIQELVHQRDAAQEVAAMNAKSGASWAARVQELETQLESIGAGGVEPLRSRCLHQIAEPAVSSQQDNSREDASYASLSLAEMVLSDCGHSSNYTPLLERVAGRIDRHVERLLTAQQADRAMRAQAAPAAVAGPSDDEILALNAGEIHFSESPSKYPWAGHGTQYHAGAPGVLNFARAVLARWGAAPTTQAAPQPAAQQEAQEPDAFYLACEVLRIYGGGPHTITCNLSASKPETLAGLKFLESSLVHAWRAGANAAQRAAPVAQGDAEDAARYRWLRDFHADEIHDEFPYVAAGENYEGAWALSGDELDAAIDAARSQAKEGGAA